MNRTFKYYSLAWAIMLLLFNLVAFVIPESALGHEKFNITFWVSYASVSAGFIGQIICTYIAFKANNLKEFFYNTPLIVISYIGLILTIAAGLFCMYFPGIPYWIAVIICVVILAFVAVSVIKAKASAELIIPVEEKIKKQTSFIKNMTLEANMLTGNAKSSEAKACCKEVYDTFRYSDPMSCETLDNVELEILNKFEDFKISINDENSQNTRTVADELIQLIKKRNEICKINK